jgi:hypothetical protein
MPFACGAAAETDRLGAALRGGGGSEPWRKHQRRSIEAERARRPGAGPELALAVASQTRGAGLHNSTEHRSGTGSAPHIGLRHIPLRPAKLLAPLHGSDWDAPALGDFYNQAFNGSVSLHVAGYDYNSGWISFCWRDSHPLEWQLAHPPAIRKWR